MEYTEGTYDEDYYIILKVGYFCKQLCGFLNPYEHMFKYVGRYVCTSIYCTYTVCMYGGLFMFFESILLSLFCIIFLIQNF